MALQQITEKIGQPITPITNKQPPRADATDVNQASDPAIEQYNQLRTTLPSGLSYTEGMQMARENWQRAKANTESVSEFQQSDSYKQNLSAAQNFDRVSGQRPSDILSTALGMQETSRNILSEAASREASGLNALTNILQVAQDEARQQQDDLIKRSELNLRMRQQQAEDLDKGRVWDEATGTYRAAKPEDYLTTPTGEPLSDQQKQNALLTGGAAVAKASQQGAGDYISSFKSVDERTNVAQQILQAGGWQEYAKTLNYNDLLTDDEAEANKISNELLQVINDATDILEQPGGVRGVGAFGEGFLGGLFGGLLSSKEGRQLRSYITEITAKKIQEMSGKVVSDAEYRRLTDGGFLPTVNDSEEAILTKLEVLADRLNGNKEILRKSKLENISLDEAYEKYKDQFLGDESGDNKVKMQSPDGKNYYVDPSEVDEAINNGWRKI